MVRSSSMLRQAAQSLLRTPHPALLLSSAVRSALTPSTKAPLVALESTIITHGLPYPLNLEVAQELEQTIIDHGAVPATIALLDGKPLVGLDQPQLERLAQCAIDQTKNEAIKASRRDIAHVLAKGKGTVGGTTVSGTMVLAHMAGIKIFATGGIGGVHRGAESTMDVSADLTELGRTPVAVFCSGPKSILDIPRTLEVLETHGVSVTTFNSTGEFPAFYTSNSGLYVPYAGTDAQAAASIFVNHQLGLESGQVFANPIPSEWNEVGARIQQSVEQAVRESVEQGIAKRGKEVTPWLLKRLAELIPESKKSNRALVVNNAKKAAQVAVELHHIEKDVEHAGNTHALGAIDSTSSSEARILIFGAAAVDITSRTNSAGAVKLAATTYPGRVSVTLGGVARNMAETATRVLQPTASPASVSPVKLISPHGSDQFGLLLRTGMQQMGMRTDGLFVPAGPSRDSRTAVCSLMLEDGGDLISGVADMDIGQTALYPRQGLEHGGLQSMLLDETPEMVVFDGNIGAEQAAELLTACETYNANTKGKRGSRRLLTLFEPTSIAKSTIVLQHFASTKSNRPKSQPITFATPNAVELEQIYSQAHQLGLVPSSSSTTPEPSIDLAAIDRSTLLKAQALVDAGIFATVLLKVGRHGVVTVDAERIHHHPIPAGEVQVVNTTGCGDSFAGAFVATLCHLLQTRPSEEWYKTLDTAVEIGQLAARNTLASQNAVGEGMHLLLRHHT
ncbi:Pseudouridine-5'-phosphate glycosidase [Kalmanozyma brasiliensis GHG001]|uniref:Carbohydrate kinase PfkB domain-containing protein n=1 Tax=Kalmanozyma brasiliensis (strain GHG001) TaxID=1365824 RepID=V5EVH5_KALBG|nr:Pseudouridine-5'-phosphate glycosidase [Kalmanozyma brasiliensis GHG001]EST07253.1 Pseudouridine-5'-phosphate glycosidase [Kalmanozyma brasiliensis GHG001]